MKDENANFTSISGIISQDSKGNEIKGKVVYRDINIKDLLIKFKDYRYEQALYLLIYKKLPSKLELEEFNTAKKNIVLKYHKLQYAPVQKNDTCMIYLQKNILNLFNIDNKSELLTEENMINQTFLISNYSVKIIAKYCGFKIDEDDSLAHQILKMVKKNRYDEIDVRLLDIILMLYIDHGAGNNSTYTTRVLTSAETNIYSTISASIGSLSGKKHGGANFYVSDMMNNIKSNCDYKNKKELTEYLKKIINKQAYLKNGIIYGLGHAIYKVSDPRAEILRSEAYKLAKARNKIEIYNLYRNVEIFSKELLRKKNGNDFKIATNCDYYVNLILKILEIPEELFTPIFAISRVNGWCVHRIEQVKEGNKLIRPKYKYKPLTSYDLIERKKNDNKM